ncbi:PorT family protein [Pontibacter sp. FD36]|uniref:outer membrane beta-barrel protein n=1 Tax=Pontibacter sp. FD36 TaxID=2789860 RepID=UPI0018AB5323|nr:outer membrane beta-barrel protein [Pontibacter sp. FD36]MBF8963501.1 PorT family protein [Pontibacter sp. FD36]
MKNLVLTIFALVALSTAAQAQFLTGGLKAGVGSSSVSVHDVTSNPAEYANKESVTSYHAGAFARVNILGFFIQPEAIFTQTGGRLESNPNTSITNRVSDIKFNRLDVPIMAGISIANLVRIQAGPVASNLLSARQEGQSIKSFMSGSDWGYQAGIGLDIQRLTVDVRYERINRNYSDPSIQSNYDLANEQILLSLGLKLF